MDKNNLTPEDEEALDRTAKLMNGLIDLTKGYDFIEIAAAMSAVFGLAIWVTDQEKDLNNLMKKFAYCARTSIDAQKKLQTQMTPNEQFSGWKKLSKMWIHK